MCVFSRARKIEGLGVEAWAKGRKWTQKTINQNPWIEPGGSRGVRVWKEVDDSGDAVSRSATLTSSGATSDPCYVKTTSVRQSTATLLGGRLPAENSKSPPLRKACTEYGEMWLCQSLVHLFKCIYLSVCVCAHTLSFLITQETTLLKAEHMESFSFATSAMF